MQAYRPPGLMSAFAITVSSGIEVACLAGSAALIPSPPPHDLAPSTTAPTIEHLLPRETKSGERLPRQFKD